MPNNKNLCFALTQFEDISTIVAWEPGSPTRNQYTADSNHPLWPEIRAAVLADDPRALDIFDAEEATVLSESVDFVSEGDKILIAYSRISEAFIRLFASDQADGQEDQEDQNDYEINKCGCGCNCVMGEEGRPKIEAI